MKQRGTRPVASRVVLGALRRCDRLAVRFAAPHSGRQWHKATVRQVAIGVRPLGWTVSCGGFDSLPGVVILELCRAQIAERGV